MRVMKVNGGGNPWGCTIDRSWCLRVPTGMLTLEPFSEDQGRSAVHPRGIPPISFLAPYGFTHPL